MHAHTGRQASRDHETRPVFFSHQWLGFNEPDPCGLHFRTVCNACEFLLERDGLDADNLYVWVDYSSIPQEDWPAAQMHARACARKACMQPGHARAPPAPGSTARVSRPQACKYTQTLSISSLAVYASHVR